jgi:hypothetical protein
MKLWMSLVYVRPFESNGFLRHMPVDVTKLAWISGNPPKCGVIDRLMSMVHLTILQIKQNITKSMLIPTQYLNFLNIWKLYAQNRNIYSHRLARNRSTYLRCSSSACWKAPMEVAGTQGRWSGLSYKEPNPAVQPTTRPIAEARVLWVGVS